MKKHHLIIVSAALVVVFFLLFYLKDTDPRPDSEVKHFMTPYKGHKGLVVVKMPDFLLGEIIQTDSLNVKKNSFHAFRIMILHEDETKNIKCRNTEKKLTLFLDSLEFEPLLQQTQTDSARMQVYYKPNEHNWKENVTVYTSDSTMFLFNFITNITNDQIITFSKHLSKQNLF